MSKEYNLIDTNTGTFAGWLTQSNDLFEDMSNIIVTVSNTATYANITNNSTTTGNGHIEGAFSAVDMVIKTSIHGGDATNTTDGFDHKATLFVTSNVTIGTSGTPENLIVWGNSTLKDDVTIGTGVDDALLIESNTNINGQVFFHANAQFDDSDYLKFGTSGDVSIQWDGSNLYTRFETSNANFVIEDVSGNDIVDIDVDSSTLTIARYDDEAGGPSIVLLDEGATPDANNVGGIFFKGQDDGSAVTEYAYIRGIAEDNTNTTEDGSLTLYTTIAGTRTAMIAINEGSDTEVSLRHNGSEKLQTQSFGVDITGELQSDSLDVDGVWDILGVGSLHANTQWDDNARLKIGTGADLQIYHDGTRSYINETGFGNLWIKGQDISIKSAADEDMAYFANDGAVTLYYDNSTKFATTTSGVAITGAATISTTLGVTGESTLASATVSDLTNNRVVIAGTAGSLEDDANLTFDGTTFEVGGGYGATGVDIATNGNVSMNGNLVVDGTLTTAGLTTLNGGITADSGAFTVADTSGNIETTGTLTVGGMTTLNGGITADSGAFTVADTSGNIETTGTLTVGGQTTIAGGYGNTGTTITSAGNISTNGTLTVDNLASLDGGIDVDGVFTVANATGNVSTSGTLRVTNTTDSSTSSSGAAVITGGLGVGKNLFVGDTVDTLELAVANSAVIGGDVTIDGGLTVAGELTLSVANATFVDLTVTGDTTIGNQSTDTVTIGARVNSDIVPYTDSTYDLGTNALRYALAYVDDAYVTANVNIQNAGHLKFYDTDNSNFVAFKSAGTVGTNVVWTLPATDGAANEVLKTNGSGELGWAQNGAQVSNDETTASAFRLYFATTTTGALTAVKQDSGLTYTPSSGTLTTGALSINGNIAVTGTVDGYDVSTMGTKLAGIETGATADQTASEILTLIKTVDGAGSGLDADLLDGISSGSFLRSDAGDIKSSGNLTFNDNVQLNLGTSNDVTIYHNGTHTLVNVNNGNFYINDGLASAFIFTPPSGTLEIRNSSAAGDGASILMRHDSASPAASDVLGIIHFQGDDDTGTNMNYATIDTRIVDPTNTSEDGSLLIYAYGAGSNHVHFSANSGVTTLYHNGSAKIATASGGVTITGTATASTGISGQNVRVGITGANEIDTSTGNLTIDSAGGTTTIDDNLTVTGNLTVSGTTTTVNTETVNIADNIIVLNSNYTGTTPSENGGIEIERGTLANKTLVWDETNDRWTVGSETFVAATFIGNLTGNVTGNVTGSSGSTTGNAATATTLQTARTIGGVSFNGSANIDLPGVNTTGNQNTTGSAATLTTARTINGVSFNGSANITVEPYIEDDEGANANRNVVFVDNSTAGYKRLNEDSTFYYNPFYNRLYAGTFDGALNGNASTATKWATARTNTVTLTGNVTGSGNASVDGTGNWTVSFATTIPNDTVTYAKMQNVSVTSRILGRITAGAGDVEELTAANVRSIINVADGATNVTNNNQLTNGAGYVTTAGARSALSHSAATGAYNSTTGVISIPTHTSHLTNNSGYVTSSGVTQVTSGNGLTGTVNTTGSIAMSGSYTGSFSATGDITAFSSDIRLKTNIRPIENALDKVGQLNGFIYNFNEIAEEHGFDTTIEHIGVSAQDVQKVMPQNIAPAPFDVNKDEETGEVTSKTGENYMTVKYEKIVPLLIEAIKELKAELDELKKGN